VLEEEPDYTHALVEWLADKDEDVWFDCVDHINWDDGIPVLLWMVSQPKCTQQLATRIFWMADPSHIAEQELEGQNPSFEPERTQIIQAVIQSSKNGLYRIGKVSFQAAGSDYRALLKRYAPQSDPLKIPEALFQSFDGRMPLVDPEYTPYADPALWDLHYGLGTACGERPGNPRHTSPALPYRTQYEIDQLPDDERRALHRRPAEPQYALGFSLIGFSLAMGSLLYWLWS
jgi:hypothetical protein